jgi:hypothetical protein
MLFVKKIENQERPEFIPFFIYIIRYQFTVTKNNGQPGCPRLHRVFVGIGDYFPPFPIRSWREGGNPIVISVETNAVGVTPVEGKLPILQDAQENKTDVFVQLIGFLPQTINCGDQNNEQQE